MNRLRLVYGKSKDAIYISQEETVKILNDTFIKAQIPIVKSNSTNMVDIMFAHPLTDGYQSTGEIVEIFLTEEVDTRYLIREMNKVIPDGFIIMSAEYVPATEEYKDTLVITNHSIDYECSPYEPWKMNPVQKWAYTHPKQKKETFGFFRVVF